MKDYVNLNKYKIIAFTLKTVIILYSCSDNKLKMTLKLMEYRLKNNEEEAV